MMSTAFVGLNMRDRVKATREFLPGKMWDYAAECDDIVRTMTTWDVFEVVDISRAFPRPWVRLEATTRHPTCRMKISGEEFAAGFAKI